MPGNAGTGHGALVHADVEAVRARRSAQGPHRVLSERAELADLVRAQVRVVGDVPVRHGHQVPGVVRIQVQHRVDELAAGDDQPVVVRRLAATGAALDVSEAVRSPEPAERVGLTGEVLGRLFGHSKCAAVGDSLTRRAAKSAISSTARATGMPLRCSPSRYRKETAPFSASVAPAISMNGTFCRWALRIFRCIRSSESSTSTRTPAARSFAATSFR